MKKPNQVVGQNIYRLRLKADLTQVELADFTGMGRSYLQSLEHGKVNPGINSLAKIRAVLKCSWQDLVGNV